MIEELKPEIKAKAVEVIRGFLSENDIANLRILREMHPVTWLAGLGMMGMEIRNRLREAGLTDDLTPSGNWEHCYKECLEEAITNAK